MIHPLQNWYWGNQNWGLNKHNKLGKINIVSNPLTTTSIKIREGIKWLTWCSSEETGFLVQRCCRVVLNLIGSWVRSRTGGRDEVRFERWGGFEVEGRLHRGWQEKTVKVKGRDRSQRERRVRVLCVSLRKKGYWRIFHNITCGLKSLNVTLNIIVRKYPPLIQNRLVINITDGFICH